ncbi:succinylglutamate-semialdehyde dehydrogenase [Chlamydiales bacterium]|nr:succinylglutamate-semialdehyde dehydrogenase [Chlamydiales bacterium]
MPLHQEKKMISKNPSTGEILFEGKEATLKEVDEAFKNAKEAFLDWSNLSLETRYHYLTRFQDSLIRNKERLSQTISSETGKMLRESEQEVDAMAAKIPISWDAYNTRCPTKEKSVPLGKSVTRHHPHGVCGVLGPYNFPGHLPNGHIIPALLAGNTVVFKPSEFTPLTAIEMINCWKEVDLPKGVINLVLGGKQVGERIVQSPELNALFFTGSAKTGLILSNYFGNHPEKILALEGGGNNPLIVSKIHDLKAAAYIAIQSAFITTGQRCSCTRRLIVVNNDPFIETLLSLSKTIEVGTFMGPLIHEEAALNFIKSQEELIAKGGIPLLKGEHLKKNTGFVSCSIIDMTKVNERPDEEIFGPLLQIIRVNSLHEAITIANSTSYGLACGILSDDIKEYEQVLRKGRAGIINWNTPTTGALSSNPFGGIGISGNGHPSAYYAADYCSYPVASVESEVIKPPSKVLPGIQYHA